MPKYSRYQTSLTFFTENYSELKELELKVKKIFDKYPDAVHHDWKLLELYIKEYFPEMYTLNLQKAIENLIIHKIKINSLSRAGRKLRAKFPSTYYRNKDRSKKLEEQYKDYAVSI